MQETILFYGGVIGILLMLFLSAFIIYFDRKKFASPRLGIYYLLIFFMAGIIILAIGTIG